MKTIVSKGSRVWLIKPHPLYAPRDLRISWGQLLPPPADESKHERAYLRESVKQYFYASILHSESRTGVLSPGTVQLKYRRIRVLCRWMAEKKIWRLSALVASDIKEFLNIRLMSPRNSVKNSGLVTRSSIAEYCEIFEELWTLRELYVAPLRVNVPELIGVRELIMRAPPSRIWPAVELPIAKKLLLWALAEIEKAATVEEAIAEVWLIRKRSVGSTSWAQKKECTELLERLDFRHRESQAAVGGAQVLGLQRSIRNLVGAVLLIILFFTGMRISEVLTLQTDCLVQRLHSDGRNYSYLKGHGAKRRGRERLWVVPEIVVEVVRLQVRLFENLRALHKVPILFLSKFETMRILTGRLKPQKIVGSVANRLMREVIRSADGDLSDLSTTFHAHRARKTFARFVVMRDKTSLESLAHHYGHVYAAVLDRHYVGNDFRLDELIRAEDIDELRLGLSKILESTNIGGKAGASIMVARDKIASTAGLRGKLTLDGLVEKLIQSGLILAPCDWGYCVYARELSKCKGSMSGPNPIQRAPSVCASCANFAVVDHHLPWWERRYSEQSNFLNRVGIPEQTRRVVSAQLEMTEKILSGVVRRRTGEGTV